MTVRQLAPALVTALTLSCGVAALEAVRVEHWALALWLILAAAVADGVDGMLARRLQAVSAMGTQLDSLADIIAFGVAPAFLFATYYSAAPDWVRFGVALTFVLAGAYRLARFHAQPARSIFYGLPITAGGTLLALIVAGPFGAGVWDAAMAGTALIVLMVCRHPFPKVGRSRQWLLPVLAAASLPLALWPRVETLAIVAGFVLASYVLWGLAGMLLGDKLQAIGINEVEVQPAGQPRA